MKTECTKQFNSFQALGKREIVADFCGGTITSDGGGLLLREVEQRTAILQRFAGCFTDYRDERRIEQLRIDTTPSTADLAYRKDLVGVVSIHCSRSP